MCLAIPSKVVKIKDDWATVKSGDHQHRVDLSLLKNVKIGDYLIFHDNLAINKIPKKQAQQILDMIENHASELNK